MILAVEQTESKITELLFSSIVDPDAKLDARVIWYISLKCGQLATGKANRSIFGTIECQSPFAMCPSFVNFFPVEYSFHEYIVSLPISSTLRADAICR